MKEYLLNFIKTTEHRLCMKFIKATISKGYSDKIWLSLTTPDSREILLDTELTVEHLNDCKVVLSPELKELFVSDNILPLLKRTSNEKVREDRFELESIVNIYPDEKFTSLDNVKIHFKQMDSVLDRQNNMDNHLDILKTVTTAITTTITTLSKLGIDVFNVRLITETRYSDNIALELSSGVVVVTDLEICRDGIEALEKLLLEKFEEFNIQTQIAF